MRKPHPALNAPAYTLRGHIRKVYRNTRQQHTIILDCDPPGPTDSARTVTILVHQRTLRLSPGDYLQLTVHRLPDTPDHITLCHHFPHDRQHTTRLPGDLTQ